MFTTSLALNQLLTSCCALSAPAIRRPVPTSHIDGLSIQLTHLPRFLLAYETVIIKQISYFSAYVFCQQPTHTICSDDTISALRNKICLSARIDIFKLLWFSNPTPHVRLLLTYVIIHLHNTLRMSRRLTTTPGLLDELMQLDMFQQWLFEYSVVLYYTTCLKQDPLILVWNTRQSWNGTAEQVLLLGTSATLDRIFSSRIL